MKQRGSVGLPLHHGSVANACNLQNAGIICNFVHRAVKVLHPGDVHKGCKTGAITGFIRGLHVHMVQGPAPDDPVPHRQYIAGVGTLAVLICIPAGVVLLGVHRRVQYT